MGALITILGLAYEPFLQQILTYPQRLVPVGHSLTWAATTFVQDVQPLLRKTGLNTYKDPALSMTIDAVFNTPSVDIRPSTSKCSTGTCTWPTYSTLGVCHQCQDVSNLLQYMCQNGTSLKLPAPGSGATDPCGFRLNDTFIVGSTGAPGFRRIISLSVVVVDTFSMPSLFGPFLNSTVFANATLPVVDFYIGYTPGGPSAALRNETPILNECLLTCK